MGVFKYAASDEMCGFHDVTLALKMRLILCFRSYLIILFCFFRFINAE